MTKTEIRTKIVRELGEATSEMLQNLTYTDKEYYQAKARMLEVDFLIDKLSDLQYQIQELKSQNVGYILKPDGCE